MDSKEIVPANDEETIVIPGLPGTLKKSGSMNAREFERQRRLEQKSVLLPRNQGNSQGPTEEELAKFHQEKLAKASTNAVQIEHGQERSVLHSRTPYLDVPRNAPDAFKYPPDHPSDLHFNIPKKIVFTLTGHARGVTSIDFIPRTGHLLLSGSIDTRVKLWSVCVDGDRTCVRSFLGHNKPVRSVQFNHTGDHFLSISGDKFIKHWDVESGKCLVAIEHRRMPTAARYCVKRPDMVLVGGMDGKVGLWDLRGMHLVREYAHHTEQINSITFASPFQEQSENFITTSEDRTIRVWNIGETVPLHILGKPEICDTFPTATVHPTQPVLLCASYRSELASFNISPDHERLSLRPKMLIGHETAGMVSKPAFSHDGRFAACGDGKGRMCFWDWTSGQLAKVLEGHGEAVTNVAWCPADTKLFASASLDGTINLWE